MDFHRVLSLIAGLKLMKYFPSDEDAWIELAKDLADMAENEEQVQWLVKRVRNLYAEWPGVHELRAVFCSRFKPKDGINAYSSVYLDGVPLSRPERVQITAPEFPQIEAPLPPGHVASVDPQLENMVRMASAGLPKMPPAYLVGKKEIEFAKKLEEVLTAPIDREPEPPEPKTTIEIVPQRVITQADIDEAVRQYREQKAKGNVSAS